MKHTILLLALLILNSCTDFVKKVDDDFYYSKINQQGSDSFSILFSHNINGETHPCGCRHFPLGGLAQIAGIVQEEKKQRPYILIDTGDTFFPSSNLPDSMKKSLTFIANELISSLEDLGLQYYLPGDQDFAMGESFLAKLSNRAKFTFVISNLSNISKIKHKKYVAIQLPQNRKLFLTGVLSREVLQMKHRKYVKDEFTSLKNTMKEIESNSSSDDIIVLLSHSGIDKDKKIAKSFPRLNWILGAHSQSFLKEPVVVGKTQMVQVLSRNHYLGRVKFPFNNKSAKYDIIEVRDNWKDKIENNPFVERLVKHKEELKKIQIEEQNSMADADLEGDRIPTAVSCLECHKEQTHFWQKTAHSIAYQTLIAANEEKNPSCIGCHTVGFQKKKGFSTYKHLVLKNKKPLTKNQQTKYWNKISDFFKPYKDQSIREMKSSVRRKISSKWMAHDKKEKLSHNFANVQCLNCHDKSSQHPFEEDEPTSLTMQSKCLKCHTTDQSPSWYLKNKKGLAGKLDKKVYQAKLKQVACPKQ